MSIQDYGYIREHYTVVTAKVSSVTTAIVAGDKLVLAGVGANTPHAGYVKKWTAASDPFVGVALTPCAVPTADGDLSVEMVLPIHGPIFCYPATGIAQKHCFQFCDSDGAQSIDIDAEVYRNAWIVEVDATKGVAYVMFVNVQANATGIDYGIVS